jgi:hypothetical protein
VDLFADARKRFGRAGGVRRESMGG